MKNSIPAIFLIFLSICPLDIIQGQHGTQKGLNESHFTQKDQLVLPDTFEVMYVLVKQIGKRSTNHYFFDFDSSHISLLPKNFFSTEIPDFIQKNSLEHLVIDDLKYLKILRSMVFTRSILEDNTNYAKSQIRGYAKSFFAPLIYFVSGGFLIDILGFKELIGFYFFTNFLGRVGIAYGIIGVIVKVWSANYSKKGKFKKKHLLKQEKINFKIGFDDDEQQRDLRFLNSCRLKPYSESKSSVDID